MVNDPFKPDTAGMLKGGFVLLSARCLDKATWQRSLVILRIRRLCNSQCDGNDCTERVRFDPITNLTGVYQIPGVAPGEYTIEAAAVGFATSLRTVHFTGRTRVELRPYDHEKRTTLKEGRGGAQDRRRKYRRGGGVQIGEGAAFERAHAA